MYTSSLAFFFAAGGVFLFLRARSPLTLLSVRTTITASYISTAHRPCVCWGLVVFPLAVRFVGRLQLAAKEAYLQAKAEIADEDRRRILAEFRTLIQEAATTAAEAATEKVASKAAAAAALAAAESAVLDAAAGSSSSSSGGTTETLGEETPTAAAAAAAAASTSNGHSDGVGSAVEVER